MRSFKSLIAVATLALCSLSATAQEASNSGRRQVLTDTWRPSYGFIQMQGGVNTTLTDVSCFKLLTPTYSIGGGAMFRSTGGVRVHVNGWKATGGFDNIVGLGNTLKKYEYNYINSSVDLLINVVNFFSSSERHPIDLYLIAGIGVNYAWDNDEFETLTSQYQVRNDISNAWGSQQNLRHRLWGHNFRAGILADVNLAKHWSIGTEIDFNSLDDRFNSKNSNSDDWMITAQLSLTYKFGHTKRPPLPPTVDESILGAFNNSGNQGDNEKAPTIIPEVKDETIKETIFFALREVDLSDATIITKVADWCKKNPNKTITVSGYADAGTGTASLNAEFAQQRAEKVANALKEKGVPASQMAVKSYGDTVQPFAENDMNRCVIIEGK
jgi:outer membrane protein OmpA-like peptidoglycan-associated protein